MARVFTHLVNVRYVETDAMGVVHHSAYVPWLEEARIALLSELGHSYAELEASGVFMPVVQLEVTYRRSLRFGQRVELQTQVEQAGPSRLIFHSRLLIGHDCYATAAVTVATVNGDGRIIRIPEAVLAAALMSN